MRKGLCFLVLAGMLLVVSAAAAEDQVRTISGHVIDVDPRASQLVVSYTDNSTNALVNIELYVPSNAVLMGGTETIMLDDVQISDRVEIEYTGDVDGSPEVKRLVDLDRTNW